MIQKEIGKLYSKQDVLIMGIVIFCMVIMAIGYDAYQKRTTDTQELTVDSPPIIINELDTKIFFRLSEMDQ